MKVSGYITIKYEFDDIFPITWDEEDIEDFIKKNFEGYINDDAEYENCKIEKMDIGGNVFYEY